MTRVYEFTATLTVSSIVELRDDTTLGDADVAMRDRAVECIEGMFDHGGVVRQSLVIESIKMRRVERDDEAKEAKAK